MAKVKAWLQKDCRYCGYMVIKLGVDVKKVGVLVCKEGRGGE